MGKLLGFSLILSGLALGGVGVPLSAGTSGPSFSSPAEGIAVGARALIVEKSSHSGFAAALWRPGEAMVRVAASDATLRGGPEAVVRKVPEPRPAERPPAPLPARKPLAAFETIVIPEDPAALARALQAELARVGCYEGPASGTWSPASRRAMKAFTERVNATLPIDKPDFILLSLVKAQPGRVCGKSCPSGQSAASDGRCIPQAILAQAARKAAPPRPVLAALPEAESKAKPEAIAPALKAAPATEFLASVYTDNQRMALAGPKDPEVAVPPPPVASGLDKDTEAAKRARKREAREPTSGKTASFGQTRWAREFFRNNGTF